MRLHGTLFWFIVVVSAGEGVNALYSLVNSKMKREMRSEILDAAEVPLKLKSSFAFKLTAFSTQTHFICDLCNL